MNELPPKVFLKFFRWYCHPRLVDHIEGDLQEVYKKRVIRRSKRYADAKFMLDVILLIRPGIVKRMNRQGNMNTIGMYKSYFTMGWRTLLKNKGYSVINIGGLALGMTVAILIGMWMYDELSFNKYHHNYDRIALVRNLATDPHTGITRWRGIDVLAFGRSTEDLLPSIL
jgi:putative ABC transport system permease protein